MPKLFKVGGCVRDSFLGIDSKDIDFTFVLDNLEQTVEQGFSDMETWMTERGFQIFLSTPDMFTIRAKFPKGDPNEGLVADFVMARKEIGYKPGTRQPILVLGTLEDDLIRRDFTLNAMAVSEDGTNPCLSLIAFKNVALVSANKTSASTSAALESIAESSTICFNLEDKISDLVFKFFKFVSKISFSRLYKSVLPF